MDGREQNDPNAEISAGGLLFGVDSQNAVHYRSLSARAMAALKHILKHG